MKRRIKSINIITCLWAVAFLCQCETVRTVGPKHSTKYTIAGRTPNERDDTKQIREKYANHGWEVDEQGNFKAKKDNLYADSKDAGSDSKFRTKDAKLKNSDFETKAFKTPEYLKMQNFKGVSNAREDGNAAREGNFKKSGWKNQRKLFRSKSKSTTEYATYNTPAYINEGKKFSTRKDRSGTRSLTGAPTAHANLDSTGYRENSSLTMDDVKKMLSPGSYAQGTGLAN